MTLSDFEQKYHEILETNEIGQFASSAFKISHARILIWVVSQKIRDTTQFSLVSQACVV